MLTIVTATIPTANDSAISNFLSGEGFTPQSVPGNTFTPESVSLLPAGSKVVITPDCPDLGAVMGDALQGCLAGVLLAKSGEAPLVNAIGIAGDGVSEYRVVNATVSKVDIVAGLGAGNDVQAFNPTSPAFFLRQSKLGAGFVTYATDKTDATRKLAGLYPAGSAMAHGETAVNAIGYMSLARFSNTTTAYRQTLLAVLAAL